MLFCRRMGKWDEVPYVDAFTTLYRKEKCKLTTDLVMYTASEKKESGCCIGCDNRKLQKVDGAGGMSVSQLIEIGYKVCNN